MMLFWNRCNKAWKACLDYGWANRPSSSLKNWKNLIFQGKDMVLSVLTGIGRLFYDYYRNSGQLPVMNRSSFIEQTIIS